MEWNIYRPEEDELEAFYCSLVRPSEEVLGNLLALWARDVDLTTWEDREKMAAIAKEESNLSDEEVKSIFWVDIDEVGEEPGDQPWEFTHPDGGEMILRKE